MNDPAIGETIPNPDPSQNDRYVSKFAVDSEFRTKREGTKHRSDRVSISTIGIDKQNTIAENWGNR